MHFLTNILQNRRKRISAKLLEDSTRHGHTLSQPAHNVGQQSTHGEMPFECCRCCIAKKEERKAGGGGGGWRPAREPVETHSIFVVFFLMCCCFFTVHRGGGGNCSYSLFH